MHKYIQSWKLMIDIQQSDYFFNQWITYIFSTTQKKYIKELELENLGNFTNWN